MAKFLTISAFIVLCTWATACAEPTLLLLPASVELRGPEDSQRIIAVIADNGQSTKQMVAVELKSSDPAIVEIRGATLISKSNGEATITATSEGQTATATVKVTGIGEPQAWSFRHDVQPLFAKLGCNSGACHGALAGKGGFRLSLAGYDPAADHFRITREARGRRVELADPGRSLLLTKPTGALAHKGGVRFEVDEEPYKIISAWIQQGAAPPRDDEARVTHLTVLPDESLLTKDAQHDLLLLAHYDDGRVRDVTRFAKFTATDEAVATVDKNGRVTVVGPGEGAVVAWFDSQVKLARITSPYANDVSPEVFAKAPRTNYIDELVLAQLEKLRLPPSPTCTDAEFLRRAHLDTIGVLPTADETRKFLADISPDKRAKLIDELLARPEYVDYWAYKWSDLLLVDGRQLRPAAVKAYYMWIRQQVADNTPWDEIARRVVTSRGSSTENGATNFFAIHQTPEDMSENVSQAFMGLSIGCAKCHNHPLEKWTNDQYYSFANLFARVRAKGWGGDSRSGDGLRTLYVADSGELIQPSKNKPQPPAPLDAPPLAFDDTGDRRDVLAGWLTSPENPYFSRAIANRVWANYLGVGLVEQIDDLRLSNPASNEPLLAALAQHLADNKYDLKSLMRDILRSETYQRSSRPLPENAGERRYYSHYYPRRLMAEVLHDAIVQVTEVPTLFDATDNIDSSTNITDFYPLGTRAMQLYDSSVVSNFLEAFGRNERAITCECERSDEPTIVQVLQISNGDVVNRKLADEKGRVAKIAAEKHDDARLIEDAYLTALSRFPTDSETQQFTTMLQATPEGDRRAAIEDLYWSILSSREFLFQH